MYGECFFVSKKLSGVCEKYTLYARNNIKIQFYVNITMLYFCDGII